MLNQELLEVKKYREVLKDILVVIHCDYHLYTACDVDHNVIVQLR